MTFDIDRLQGSNIVDQDGDKVGSIGQVYVDDQSNEPTFATVKTGLFGNKETFVPLNHAEQTGDDLRVPYTKDFIKDAPNIDADGHLSEQEQDQIYDYYKLDGARSGYGDDNGRTGERQGFDGRDTAAAGAAGGAAGTAGYEGTRGRDDQLANDRRDVADGRRGTDLRDDQRGLADDRNAGDRTDGDSMVRREEELKVGTERVQTGRVRLRKHVVTEQRTVTVPVEREEVEVVREPINDGNATSGGRLGEDEQTVELSEERPVVDKQVVDKERVGLQTNTVQDQQQVQAEVGREEISVDQDGADGVRGDGVRGDGYDNNLDANGNRKEGLVDKAKDRLRGDKDHDGVKDKYEN